MEAVIGNWNIHSVEIFMFPNNFSLQIWVQDICQEGCPQGSLPVGGLASLQCLVFIERSLTVPVEICFYKSAFSIGKKKKKFLSKISDYL